MKTKPRKGWFDDSSLRSDIFGETVEINTVGIAAVADTSTVGLVPVSSTAAPAAGSNAKAAGSSALAASGSYVLAAAAATEAGLDIAAAAAKSGYGAGGNPAKATSDSTRGVGFGEGGNPEMGNDGDGSPEGGITEAGAVAAKRPEGAGKPDNGNGEGGGDGVPDKPDDTGNPGNGRGDGDGDGDGISDRPPPAPTPADVPLLDAETVQYRASHIFEVGDVTVGWHGETLATRPESLDLTTSKIARDGTVLNPIDSEFGFYVTDFVGARDKVFDDDYGEGWVGALSEGGIALADSPTDVFSTPARLGTWLEGIGGNTVKASTEHYSVMQAILSDQNFPGDESGYYQLDDDLKIVDYLAGEDGMPVDATGAPSARLVPGAMHGFYVKELVQALGNAEGGDEPAPAPFIDFSEEVILGFQPVAQDRGDFTISADGLTFTQEDDSQEMLLGDVTITAETRLQFEFSADVVGEIHAIMFTNGELAAPATTVRIAGTQDWGLSDYATYVPGSGVQQYDIAIGELFTGSFDRMVFITDNDAGDGANSIWSHVALTDGSTTVPAGPIDFDCDGVDDDYNAFMTDIDFGGVTRNVAAVDIGNDGTIDYHDSNLNGFGIFGLQDILQPNESSIIQDIAAGDDYSVTVKDDGKLLYRWGNAVKRPNDIRVDVKIDLPDEWKADDDGDGFADSIYKVSAAELVVSHTVTNNPNDQIRPEDFENESAIGILPAYVEVRDPFDADGYEDENGVWQGNVLWVADKGVYAGDGTFLPSYFAAEDTGTVVVGLDGVPLGYYNPGGTVLRDFSLIEKADGSTLADIGAMSDDLSEGFTEAYYTTMDREPFVADYTDDGTAYETGPRWRLQPDKYGQDLPSVVIPQDITDPPPIQNGEEKYEAGADTTTVLNLLDWDGPSPLTLSAGWMTGSGEVSVNGLNMTEAFDVAFYVKGDTKPVNLYGAELLMEYDEVPINAAGATVLGTIYDDTLIGRGGNTFDLSGSSFQFVDHKADLVVMGYGATTPLGLGDNTVYDFGAPEGDAIGLIGFGLDADNYTIHITQEVVADSLLLSLDGEQFATLHNVAEELGLDSFYFA